MHQYLSAIGFKNTFPRESEIELLLDNLFQSFDSREAAREEIPGCAFLEMSKSYGPCMGIRLCGQMDAQGFHRMYYYPYLEKTNVSLKDYVTVDLKGNGDGYIGITEEGSPGISIIFFLQNPAMFKKVSFRQILSQNKVPITLTGLSNGGKILLGSRVLSDSEKQDRQRENERYKGLIAAAKKGDQEAIEKLTRNDIDTFTSLTRRIQTEDIYSIVETTFMPGGLECDIYRVIGTILFYAKVRNSLTRQYVYQMTIDCNGLLIDICINEQDLWGDPEVGRRFKGTIWLQGMLDLSHQTEDTTARAEEAQVQ